MNDKTGLGYKLAGGGAVLGLVAVILLDGLWRGLAIALVSVCLIALAFVFVSRRLALRLIARIAPPGDLAGARRHFDAAVAEADLPTGPVALLRLVWRLRQGIGPEVERLGEVVSRLQSRLGPELDVDQGPKDRHQSHTDDTN